MSAQQSTAQSQVAASQRKLQELLAQQDLAARSGDNAAARQLEAAISNEKNNISVWGTQATIDANQAQLETGIKSTEKIAGSNISSNEKINELQLDASDKQQLLDLKSRFDLNEASLTSAEKRTLDELTSREAIAEASIASQEFMSQQSDDLQRELQTVDIGYKEWLAQTTYENSAILQGNQQASGAYSDFTLAAAEILNNPDTSAAQKRASISTLKTSLTDSLKLISETAGIDLTEFLPAVASGTAVDNTAGRNNLPYNDGDPTNDRGFNRPTPISDKSP